MGQTLTHGVYLPDEGERNCYNGLAANWQLLDGAVGTIAEHSTQIAGKAPAVHTHVKADITDFPAYGTTAGTICEGNDSRLSDARTPVAHTHTKSDVTDLLNSNFIPSANNTYDLGSSSYQWNNVYSKGYYYNGVAWGLDKANVWTGNNTFTIITTKTNVDRTVAPTSDTYYGTITCRDKNGSAMFRMQGTIKTDLSNVWDMMMVAPNNTYQTFFKYTINSATSTKELRLKADSVIPDVNSENLGTTDNPWKTLNGINPGALSLPDYDRFEPIDFSQYDVNLGWNNLYTPSEDGWLYAEIDDTATNSIYIYSSGLQPVQSVNRKYGVSAQGNGSQSGYGGRLAIMIPVRKDIQYRFLIKASAVSDIYAVIFYPCLGNV